MRRTLTLVLIACVLGQSLALAAEAPNPTSAAPATRETSPLLRNPMLSHAIDREATRLAFELGRPGISTAQPPARQDRGWIQRHPALFGAMAGAGLGAVSSIPRWTELYCASGGDEDCLFHGGLGVLVGAGAGAGVGALIGFFVGR